jgi:NAD(P)-dependent dehydrogenase (short-subunit alcohol dehydrogenase family)
MADHLTGRAAIVTGAGGGIGRAFALALAAEGARVLVNDLGVTVDGSGEDQGRAALVVHEIEAEGGSGVANADDVSDFQSAGRIVEQCQDAFGAVDILVQPAGILRPARIHEISEDEWDAVIGVHLKGSFNMIRHASPHMVARGWGRVVNVSSGAALGSPRRVNYATAKAGIFGLTYAAAQDLGPLGITVNCVCPGATDTRMVRSSQQLARQEIAAEGRSSDAHLLDIETAPCEDLAPMVVYLCTEAAADVNGNVFNTAGSRYGLFQTAITREIDKQGRWTVDELIEQMPGSLLKGLSNPAPRTS